MRKPARVAVFTLVAVGLAAACPAQGLPEVAAAAAAPASPPPAVPGAAVYLRGLPADLAAAGSSAASVRTLPWALAGAAATALAFGADDSVRDWFFERRPLEGASGAGDILGRGYTHAGAALGLFAWGQIAGSRRGTDAGFAAAEALAVNGLVALALKQAVGRARPGDGAHNAFPSGHASSTAALAASLSTVYEWRPAVAVPLGSLTAFVAASRLEDDVHWFSDVVGGAVIGGVVGFAFGDARRRRRAGGWAVLPLPNGGLLLAREF